MPRILDNIEQHLDTAMLDSLAVSHSFDAAVGYFNLRGWRLIADAVDAMPGRADNLSKVRLLVGMTEAPGKEMERLARHRESPATTNEVADNHRQKAMDEMRGQLQVGLPTEGDEAALRKLRSQMAAGDVAVRMFLAHRLHAKLYLCHREDTEAPRTAYVGSSNLTKAGLSAQGELNVDVVERDATSKLAAWFEDRWDDRLSMDVTPELIKLLDESWTSEQPLDPYLVYLKMAYHLSYEAREGLIQYGLPASMADKLLDFQAAAVKIAARIVNQRGGAIVGDVVGLGKTMVGTAIALLLQEDDGFETLIVCPKNLVDMWEDYRHTHRLHGRVLSLSMATKELPTMRRHRLVLIDESHNLRNPKRKDYMALHDYITQNDSKVLLLSATPYNKGFSDLAAQLGLFVRPDEDLGISPEEAIKEVGPAEFARKVDGHTSSLAAFQQSEHLKDWQDLMSHFLVRRNRRFIQDNYAQDDGDGRRYLAFQDGRKFYFPEREAHPIEQEVAPDDPAAAMMTEETIDAVAALLLPRYSMGGYLDPDAERGTEEQQVVDDLRHSANGNISGFNRIMMFKRLTSSGPAFLATLRRHALRNLVALHAVENDLPVPVGRVDNSLWSAEFDAQEGDLFEEGLFGVDEVPELSAPAQAYRKLEEAGPSRVRWLRSQLFTDEFADALRQDIEVIRSLLAEFGEWDAARDGKIAALVELLTVKHGDEKVLVFTEAADTAAYVADELTRRGIDNVAEVTGNSENPTELARRFAPKANPRGEGGDSSQTPPELRVLISTDVLSEGQNLQDARIIVNYDLPWAIVKLVQRAGRVDRIGQTAETVLVYSLMPAGSVDAEINLRDRIRSRLEENAELLGSDEKFFGEESERAVITGLYDEHSDYRLAADDGEEVDPVSMAYEIWRHATEEHPELAKQVESLPNVVYATKSASSADEEEGVVLHTQTVTGSDAFAFAEVDGTARRITPQEALRRARCEPATPAVPRLNHHHDLVASALDGPLQVPQGRPSGAIAGIRKKCWDRLHRHKEDLPPNLFLDSEALDEALDAINYRPLLEAASHTLANALRNQTREDLARLIVQLHREDRLCLPERSDDGSAEPSVICSLGVRRT